jgi:hypothetical protein
MAMSEVVSLEAARGRAAYPPPSSEERYVHVLGDLVEFLSDDVAVVVWTRELGCPDVRSAAAEAARRGVCLETVVEPCAGAARDAVAEALGDADPTGALASDVQWLVTLFSDLLEPERVGLRLRALGHAMCPRFHVDRVPVRMLCTYCGQGTEWLAHADVDRRLLRAQVGAGGCDPAQRPGATVRMAYTGHVVLLKGEAWPRYEGRGVVHRSPHLASGRRLMLSLEIV